MHIIRYSIVEYNKENKTYCSSPLENKNFYTQAYEAAGEIMKLFPDFDNHLIQYHDGLYEVVDLSTTKIVKYFKVAKIELTLLDY